MWRVAIFSILNFKRIVYAEFKQAYLWTKTQRPFFSCFCYRLCKYTCHREIIYQSTNEEQLNGRLAQNLSLVTDWTYSFLVSICDFVKPHNLGPTSMSSALLAASVLISSKECWRVSCLLLRSLSDFSASVHFFVDSFNWADKSVTCGRE